MLYRGRGCPRIGSRRHCRHQDQEDYPVCGLVSHGLQGESGGHEGRWHSQGKQRETDGGGRWGLGAWADVTHVELGTNDGEGAGPAGMPSLVHSLACLSTVLGLERLGGGGLLEEEGHPTGWSASISEVWQGENLGPVCASGAIRPRRGGSPDLDHRSENAARDYSIAREEVQFLL